MDTKNRHGFWFLFSYNTQRDLDEITKKDRSHHYMPRVPGLGMLKEVKIEIYDQGRKIGGLSRDFTYKLEWNYDEIFTKENFNFSKNDHG